MSGIWDVMLDALADGGGPADTLQMIDSTIVRAHHCAAGLKRGLRAWLLAEPQGSGGAAVGIRAEVVL